MNDNTLQEKVSRLVADWNIEILRMQATNEHKTKQGLSPLFFKSNFQKTNARFIVDIYILVMNPKRF